MTLAVIQSRAACGLEAVPVSVEVHIAYGVPTFHIVGLPEKEVRESKHRVRAVISHSSFEFPARRITVNLAPADLPKEGGRFDLPIALGILISSGQLPADSAADCEFIAELGLTGALRPVRGALSAAVAAAGRRNTLIIPRRNAAEVSLVRDAKVYAGDDLLAVCKHLLEGNGLTRVKPAKITPRHEVYPDFSEVRGQHHAARALEIVAAGGHNCLLVGAPGTGKTMLAGRLPGIMPPMNSDDALETMMIRSHCGEAVTADRFFVRPFRAPHHSASAVALVGGGPALRAGEVTRAHNGILFLDELPEFPRQVLDMLREPMEMRSMLVSRASGNIRYPARFQFIAAMNPCPDGSDVDESGRCPCSDGRLKRYYDRLSAPLLDRIDLHVRVPRVKWGGTEVKRCEDSCNIRGRVKAAYDFQIDRQGVQNAYLDDSRMESCCRVSKTDEALFYRAIDRLILSARASRRILKVARTISDLSQSETIEREHLLEALSYRSMDKLFKR